MNFSDKLRSLIEERDITQKLLANQLRIPVSTLGGYFQGTSEPDFETLRIIAEYFDVTADYLLGIPNSNTKNSKEDELLRIFRSLSSAQQDLYIEQGKAFIRINAKEKTESSKSTSARNTKAGWFPSFFPSSKFDYTLIGLILPAWGITALS